MKRVWFAAVLLAMLLALSHGCTPRPCHRASSKSSAEVTILSNRDYFPEVHELFQQAESSIDVMMFSARYYTEKPSFAGEVEHIPGTHWSNTNVLLDDLVGAVERGVRVRVILDSSDWNESNTELNGKFGHLLLAGGVGVYMDDPEITTHTKLILIDNSLTVVGSTNWSYYALETNNETSVLIRSKDVNQVYKEYFSEVLAHSTILSMAEGE